MDLRDITRNERVITTTIEQKELEQLAIDAVLLKAGINWRDGLKCRAFHSTRDTSTGILHDMQVEIVADLSVLPTAKGE